MPILPTLNLQDKRLIDSPESGRTIDTRAKGFGVTVFRLLKRFAGESIAPSACSSAG
jgi:hypothetical protein